MFFFLNSKELAKGYTLIPLSFFRYEFKKSRNFEVFHQILGSFLAISFRKISYEKKIELNETIGRIPDQFFIVTF